MSRRTKTAVIFISVSIMLAVIICTSSLITFANDYCTVTVEYLYRNGESAYEPYTAVFAKGENVDLTKRAVKPLPLGMGI